MIGGLFKSSSRVAMIAAAGLLSGGVAAQAADLGGNCCADLEERVAELEATTARKGNRVVSLTISGAVATNLLWHDAENTGTRGGQFSLSQSNGNDVTSSFAFTGSAKVNADVSVGFVIDFDVVGENQGDSSAAAAANGNNSIRIDDLYTWVRSARLGTIQYGRVDSAMDGIHSFGRFGLTQSHFMDEAGVTATMGAGYEAGRNNFDGNADEAASTVRYFAPVFAGFQASASFSHAGDGVAQTDTFDTWSVALKYAGEFGAFRVKAGVGHEQLNNHTRRDEQETTTVSAGISHVPTGIYLSGAYGQEEITSDATGIATTDESGWAVQVGIQQKWNSLGQTGLNVTYNQYKDDATIANGGYADASSWAFNIVQSIDAAAMTLSLGVSQHECAQASCQADGDATAVQFGSVIKF